MARIAATDIIARHDTRDGWSVAIIRNTDAVQRVGRKLVPCTAYEVSRVSPDGKALAVGGMHLTIDAARAAANKLWTSDRK